MRREDSGETVDRFRALGVERAQLRHYIVLVSAEKRAHILHGHECLSAFEVHPERLTRCFYAQAFDEFGLNENYEWPEDVAIPLVVDWVGALAPDRGDA